MTDTLYTPKSLAPKQARRPGQNMEAGNPCRTGTCFAVADAFGCGTLWLIYGSNSLAEVADQIEKRS
jgi:hypothetical protein